MGAHIMTNRKSLFRLWATFFAGLIFGFWMMAPDETSRSIEDGIKKKLLTPNTAYAQRREANISTIKVSARPRDTYYPSTED